MLVLLLKKRIGSSAESRGGDFSLRSHSKILLHFASFPSIHTTLAKGRENWLKFKLHFNKPLEWLKEKEEGEEGLWREKGKGKTTKANSLFSPPPPLCLHVRTTKEVFALQQNYVNLFSKNVIVQALLTTYVRSIGAIMEA